MSIRVRDLISEVRDAKTAAEERAVIARESAAIRTAFKDEDTTYRHRNVAKLLYMHMLGYPTHFGQMECLKLINTARFPDKRIGYLALTQLLDEESEVLMLATQAIKNDLANANPYIVGMALCALTNVSSPELCRDCATDVQRLFGNVNPHIRKKAVLCALRMVRKVPDLAEFFTGRLNDIMADRNHAVLLVALQLLGELARQDSTLLASFRRFVPMLIRSMRALISSGFAPDHDVQGVTDPFLQVTILRTLRLLAAGDADTSAQFGDLLAQIATNTDSSKNVGNSVLYECVRTIMHIASEKALRVLAINILGKFLLNRDNNVRFVALNTLARIISTDPTAVQRHGKTIVDCLQDPDIAIRRRALPLIYSLINGNNVVGLVEELIDFLPDADYELRGDVVANLCTAIEMYAPSRQWHLDTVLRVMQIAPQYIQDATIDKLATVLLSLPDLQRYAAARMYHTLTKNTVDKPVLIACVWGLGEFADLLFAGPVPLEDDGSDIVQASEEDVLRVVRAVLASPSADDRVRRFSVSALGKLSARLQRPESLATIAQMLQAYSTAADVDVQQRACEAAQLLRAPNGESLRLEVFDRVPAPEDVVVSTPAASAPKTRRATAGGDGSSAGAAVSAAPAKEDKPQDLLLDLLGLGDPLPMATTAAAAPAGGDPFGSGRYGSSTGSTASGGGLMDLLGGGPTSYYPSSAAAPYGAPSSGFGGGGLMDLLGGPAPAMTAVPIATPPVVSPAAGGGGAFADLLGGLGASPSSVAPSMATSTLMAATVMAATPVAAPMATPVAAGSAYARAIPPATAFDKDGIKIQFSFTKLASTVGTVKVLSSLRNNGKLPIRNVLLQLAVPRYLTLTMDPPSSDFATPGNEITQQVTVENSLVGQKPVVMKLRLEYDTPSGHVLEEATLGGPVFDRLN